MTPTWNELISLTRASGSDQVRSIHLHRRPGAEAGSVEARYRGDLVEAIAASEADDIGADLARLGDQITAGAIAMEVADLAGLAIIARDETGQITIYGAFTDGTVHEAAARERAAPEMKVIRAERCT